MKRDDGFTPAVASTAKPGKPTKPKVRNARNVAIDDEDGFIPNAKKESNSMTDIDRGPFAKMLDKMALAHQAQFGGSYEQAYTKIYTDPANASIRDRAQYDHLSKQHDAMHGTRLSLIPVAKAAPSYDPLAKAAETAKLLGPAHARLHSLAVDHQRAHSGMSYEQAYSHLYGRRENEALRNAVKAEHMRATMAGVGDGLGKAAAPPDPSQDFVDPSARTPAAHAELDQLVIARMKREPNLS
jgi:hypothetical protein